MIRIIGGAWKGRRLKLVRSPAVRPMQDKVKGALLLLRRAGGREVVPRVRGVSGVLAKTERFAPRERTRLPIR